MSHKMTHTYYALDSYVSCAWLVCVTWVDTYVLFRWHIRVILRHTQMLLETIMVWRQIAITPLLLSYLTYQYDWN